MRQAWVALAQAIIVLTVATGCATKTFPDLHNIDVTELNALQCKDIEQEFILLNRHEDAVNEEAVSGQVKQILWGGIWSVIADEKLEHISRKKIRDRERLLYGAKLKKKCQ